ncbi:penicillin-binding transpeptidase domain-containing protein [Patescibacteria group bacterium]
MFSKKRKSTNRASAWQGMLLKGSSKVKTRKSRKIMVFWVGLWLMGMVMAFRLVELQIVQGDYHLKRSEENRLITRRIAASRGIIRDRNGEVLTRNIPTYKRLVEGTNLAQGQFETIGRDEALDLSTSGGWVFFDISRDYLFGREMSSVLGYISQVSKEELEVVGEEYISGDLIGKSGVEKSMERSLRGLPGTEYVETASSGETLRITGRVEPIVGEDVVLSIDLGLQRVLFESLEGYSGAGVAVNPKNGQILALVSRPTFDPNDVSGSLEEEGKPFFNRAVGGAYPPGSIYKIITLTAGLEENKITSEETIEDTGEIILNGYRFGNWLYDRTGGTEGLVNAVKALQRSNDIYFYKLGELVGADKLAEWSRYFGLGKKTGISLPGEIDGLVPDPLWKERQTGVRWYLGNTYHMAIGQGDVQTTPLQMAMVTGVVANGGRLCKPQLTIDDEVSCAELGVSTETLEVIKQGMISVCQSGGTASRWSSFSPKVACKTGTAQFGGENSDKTHAWFTVFAPIDDPEIVLTVLLEGAGEGSEHASPVALKVFEEWFGGE